MTTFAGERFDGVEYADSSITTDRANELPLWHEPDVWVDTGSFFDAAWSSRIPIEIVSAGTKQGRQAASPLDDIYGTVWVVPSQIDVGRLTSDVTRQVEVWNAFTDQENRLANFMISGGDGIDLTGVSLPYTLGFLEAVLFDVVVTTNGPATVDARYVLEFDTTVLTPDFTVEGIRILEWSLPPNWQTAVKETWEYRTEILRSYSGIEQRRALRHRPRRRMAFRPLVQGHDHRLANRLLSTWQNRVYGMAHWAYGVRTQGVSAGGQTLLLDETLPELRDGGLVALRYQGNSDIYEIDTVDGDLVTLTAPVASAWPEGTLVYPAMTLHADAEISSQRLTSVVAEHSLTFREMWDAGEWHDWEGDAETTWRGAEVWTRRPNWASPLEIEHRWDFEWLDTGRGSFDFRTPVEQPHDVRTMTFLAATRDDVRAIQAFFMRHKGRQRSFWCPTWEQDLVVPADEVLTSGSTALPVDDPEDANRVSLERVYRSVVVRLQDGTRLYRRIEAGELDTSGARLVTDEAWAETIEAKDIMTIHYLPRCRFASDELTIRWLTAGVAEVAIAVQVLPDNYGDSDSGEADPS